MKFLKMLIVGVAFLLPVSAQAQLVHTRVCDVAVDYQYHSDRTDLPPMYAKAQAEWKGSWKGMVNLGGYSGKMCVSMIVQDVLPNGLVNTMWVWNLAAGDDMNMVNFQGMGSTNWWGHIEKGHIVLDPDKPYHDMLYVFNLGVPVNGKGTGKFHMSNVAGDRKDWYPIEFWKTGASVPYVAPPVATFNASAYPNAADCYTAAYLVNAVATDCKGKP
jgi:hypothetical protein